MKYNFFSRSFLIVLSITFFLSQTLTLLADSEIPITEDTSPISSSNSIIDWPQGPEIGSGSAIVIEAETGTVLYDKNMHEKSYPASITKILTALLAIENCSLNEMVTFSDNAVFSIPRDSSHIAITPKEELSVENCLYGLLLASANEVANALGEHVSGTTDKFVELMNERAKELGALNTHFNNTNGLPDENHYTTCYDMAMISREAVFNDTFIKIDSTTAYVIPPTNLQPESRPVNSLHPLLISGDTHYDGCFGGKTGYTTVAGNTLVTFAKRNNMTLICVVMKSDSQSVYSDSTALLDYGFANFQKINIAENETRFKFQKQGFFDSEYSIFKNISPQLSINTDGIIILPIGKDFSLAESSVSFIDNSGRKNTGESYPFATVTYTYNGHFIGSTTLDVLPAAPNTFAFTSNNASKIDDTAKNLSSTAQKRYITINIWYIFLFVLLICSIVFIFYLLILLKRRHTRYSRYHLPRRELRNLARRRRKRRLSFPRRWH